MDVILHYLLIESEFEFESTWVDAIYIVSYAFCMCLKLF
jgi:hypothetical protein